jgi:hypothetical protein
MRLSSIPKYLLLLSFILFLSESAYSQDSLSLFNRLLSFPDKVFGRIDREANKYEQNLTQQTDKYLNKLQRQEEKLKRKLWRTDSTKAKEVFGDVKGRYDSFRNELKKQESNAQGNTSTVYNGHLDSLGTAINFLQNNPQLQQATALKDKLSANVKSIADLKNKLNQTENIRKQIQQRQQELKQHLQNTPLAKEFRKFKKEVYYYQTQVKEYQEALKDPTKLGAKMMEVANKIPAFKDFFRRNSELASLFPLPGGIDPVNNNASFAGLQTRADVQGILQQRLGTGTNAQQYVQQQMQGAQTQMQELKNKLQQYKQGSYGNGEGAMPDFKVNNQKTKSFLQRIEWGSNMQTSKGNLYFPVTSDIGLSAGYKINDKSIIGIGASYKIGLGQSWQNINITHQGAGLRTFVDIKLKGNFWISGGGELNYRNEFRRIEVLKEMSAWQQSALLGISKRYKVGKKFNGNAQLLYDFLWKQQQPRTQALVFRVGYSRN